MTGELQGSITHDIPVRGGILRVGEWGPPGAPVLLAVHGITASHRAWPFVAAALPELRIVAPDLRGRGRSNALPGPFGMVQHADDLVAVLDALDIETATIVGHSMGAFVSVVAAHRHPHRFPRTLLVDGGLPLAVPDGMSQSEVLAATLGPAAARLSRTFESVEAYVEFWRAHPAFASDWGDEVEAYAEYDLAGAAPALRSSSSFEAMSADSSELYDSPAVREALESITSPLRLLVAPRGLQDESPGLYSPLALDTWRADIPLLRVTKVADVNHYTIVMSDRGAEAVAAAVRSLIR